MQDKKPDYSFRVVLVGDSGVGKSSLFATYRNLHVVASNEKTQRADFYEARVTRHGSLVSLKIHDTQGQERYRSLTNSYFRGTHGCVLCFDVTNRISFESLDRWLSDVREYIGKEIPCVIVGTNGHIKDCRREVLIEESITYAGIHRKTYVEITAFDNENVENVFDHLIDMMIGDLEHTDSFVHNGGMTLGEQRPEEKTKNFCSC